MDDAQKPLEAADVIREEANLLRSQGASPSFSALCISGGGIRSATFGLGAIQGLAERGLLQQFDYLSTVSGGGYIGSWLTMWATRAGGVEKIAPQLTADVCTSNRDPIGHLREYNSYLSPTVGAISSDLWTLISTVLRNVLLNWLVLVPLLLSVLTIPRAYLAILTLPERMFRAAVYRGTRTGLLGAGARRDQRLAARVARPSRGSHGAARDHVLQHDAVPPGHRRRAAHAVRIPRLGRRAARVGRADVPALRLAVLRRTHLHGFNACRVRDVLDDAWRARAGVDRLPRATTGARVASVSGSCSDGYRSPSPPGRPPPAPPRGSSPTWCCGT